MSFMQMYSIIKYSICQYICVLINQYSFNKYFNTSSEVKNPLLIMVVVVGEKSNDVGNLFIFIALFP